MEASIIWFVGLSVLGWWLGYLSWYARNDHLVNTQVLSHVSMSIGLSLSWPEVGLRIFTWLEHMIPGYGTELHTAVLLLSSGLLILCWVFLPAFWFFLFADDNGNVALSNFRGGGHSGACMKRDGARALAG